MAAERAEAVTDLFSFLQGAWCRNLEWREVRAAPGSRASHASR